MKGKEGRSRERVRMDRGMLGRMGLVLLLCGVVGFLPVIAMLANLMLVHHETYARLALDNQTRMTAITASRGTVYDRNMNILAVSRTVENVYVSPPELKGKAQDKDMISDFLAALLEKDKDWILEQMADTSLRYKLIAPRQTEEITGQIRSFIRETGVSGLHLEPDSQRVYPYGSLASQLIGFTNASNQGSEGIEASYNSFLEGKPGQVITSRGNYETRVPYAYDQYVEATAGNSLVLTIDATVQQYLEKNIQSAMAAYDVQNGAFGLVMNAKTGELLAMATLGGYDPNHYLEIADGRVLHELSQMKLAYEMLPQDSENYNAGQTAYRLALQNARLAQWRNRVVSDGYEPGSTFKIITMAAALEEGTTTLQDSFYCAGQKMFPGRTKPLHCWQTKGHGSQNTTQALQNSCNIALAHIGLSLGGARFYDYVEKFGLLEPTGIDLSGEAGGYFFPKETITDPNASGYDAAVIASSFGQTFTVTPLQLVRAIAAVVNGGWLMEPYVVSQVLDAQGRTVKQREPVQIRRVISEQTSAAMREMLLSVVQEGTAKNAAVAGYAIGGKTGTAEKTGKTDENGQPLADKIVSFVGIAPMDDPEYIVLVALDTPSRETGIYISGGVMAAPTVRGVFQDILPYLGVKKTYAPGDAGGMEVQMPQVTGMSLKEAESALKAVGLTFRTVGQGAAVTGQLPVEGIALTGGSQVILYLGQEAETDLTQVPDFEGMTAEQARLAAFNAGIILLPQGVREDSPFVTAMGQDIEPGTQVRPGTTVEVVFTDGSVRD